MLDTQLPFQGTAYSDSSLSSPPHSSPLLPYFLRSSHQSTTCPAIPVTSLYFKANTTMAQSSLVESVMAQVPSWDELRGMSSLKILSHTNVIMLVGFVLLTIYQGKRNLVS